MKIKQTLAVACICSVLCGCGQLGLATPKNIDQKLAYAESTITSIRHTAANSLLSGTITVQAAQKILVSTDEAKKLIEDARVLELSGASLSTVEGKLALATSILTQIQLLLTKGGV